MTTPEKPQKLVIRVPASTSNLGCGFDVLGMALDLHLTVTAVYDAPRSTHDTKNPDKDMRTSVLVTHEGEGEKTVPLDDTNFLVSLLHRTAEKFHRTIPQGLELHVSNRIPLGRGLGSSGAAIVAAIALADKILGLHLTQQDYVSLATEIEGHPDNVSASVLGGLVANVTDACHRVRSYPIPVPASLKTVFVIPSFEVSTAVARDVLPKRLPMSDCVWSTQRMAVMVCILHKLAAEDALGQISPNRQEDLKALGECMRDRIHQPHRQHLVPGLQEILALESQEPAIGGLIATGLSGAGPTVFALATSNIQTIGTRMRSIFTSHGVESEVHVFDPTQTGVYVTESC